MILKHFFFDEPIDFEKRCRRRLGLGAVYIAAGALAAFFGLMGSRLFPEMAANGRLGEIQNFYLWTGIGLAAVGLLTIFRNARYLKNDALRKERAVAENDERNRLLGLRCWAYAGYFMFLFLYIGILLCGIFNQAAAAVLLTVMGVYALLLLAFRMALSKAM